MEWKWVWDTQCEYKINITAGQKYTYIYVVYKYILIYLKNNVDNSPHANLANIATKPHWHTRKTIKNHRNKPMTYI